MSSEQDRTRARRWGAANRDHVAVRAAAWRKANRERYLAHARLWTQAHPARTRMAQHRWLQANPEKHAAACARWSVEHPEKRQQNKQRRRARLAQVLATLTAAEWEAILDAAGHACIYCGSHKRITQDHLIPIRRGGDHTAENVAPACRSCNSSKGAKTIIEFLAEVG